MAIETRMHLLKRRRTKILATLGPATGEPGAIRQLIEAGVNVFRLNMSHGDHDFHRSCPGHIRRIADELNVQIGVLVDLCGPKIRTGTFRDGCITLTDNSKVTVTTRDVTGAPGLIPSHYRELAKDIRPGNRILLNDGALELSVDSVSGTEITCTVIHGGTLADHKGINLPGVAISSPSLTAKDRADAEFALDDLDVDFLALSFVRTAADVRDLRDLVDSKNRSVCIIAKIEKPEALDHASDILDAADGIMVARGDLGVELSPEQVPVAQSQLIDLARAKFKPVIVATQMLESMIEHARPTRAEVTDISYAVTLGTDAVMLSAETATGAYPIEAVRMMDRIVRQTEAYLWKTGAYGTISASRPPPPVSIWDAISDTAAQLAKDLMVRAVMVLSQSGVSAATMSSARPAAPVVAITGQADICRRMTLLWSVIPVLREDADRMDPNELARNVARELQLGAAGEYVLLVRGFHSRPELNQPSVTVVTV